MPTRLKPSLAAIALVLASAVPPGAPAAVAVAAGASIDPAPREAVSGGPRLVRVSLAHGLPGTLLQREGFDLLRLSPDHALLLEWPGDAARLAALGLTPEVLDPSPGRTAAARTRAELAGRPAPLAKPVRSAVGPDGAFGIESLPPFGSGSMGGFWTRAEIKMKLDDLVASDADGVVAGKLDTLGFSWAGRPIWGLALGKASAPVVFMNALTHAREPEGMQALFRFVDDLVDRYGTDPFATYLLDHRKLYVVPLVNPDGYARNESLYVASGGEFGYWRKNARDNDGNGTFNNNQDGVDLNRNYGHAWGHDDIGSSPEWNQADYRGPAAFSEPETQAQRDAIVGLAPRTGLSFHSYGEQLMHPWAYITAAPPHEGQFHEWSDAMAQGLGDQTGQFPEILYLANGVFDDWMYGDTLSKPRVFTWTPEIGHALDGFYPPPSRIVPLADETLRACYVATAIAGPYVQAESFSVDEGAMNASYGAHLRVGARNLGLATTGAGLTGTLVPLDPGVEMLVSSVGYPALASLQSGAPLAPFQVAVDDTVTPGRLMRFEVSFTTPGGFFSRDTVAAPLGTPTVLVADDASAGLGQWSAGSWGIVASEPGHTNPFFADSPAGRYAASSSNVLALAAPFDLSAGVHAYLTFQSRFDIECGYDALFLEASDDGQAWTPLRATGTSAGSGVDLQTLGAPLYAGTRHGWWTERADLSDFAGGGGTSVWLRFRLATDFTAQYDGFALDSLRVLVFDPGAQPVPVNAAPAGTPSLALGAPAPNPSRGAIAFDVALPRAGHARVEVVDAQGRRVRMLLDGMRAEGRATLQWDGRDTAGRRAAAGVYFVRLSGDAGERLRRFVRVE